MTDRVKALRVTLAENIREDDARPLIGDGKDLCPDCAKAKR